MRGWTQRAAIWTSIAVVTLGAERPSVADRIARIERQLDLPQLMKQHNVPGISVAVIENFKTAWAKGYGVTEKGISARVTPQTLFLASSISKPVAAVGALLLVERGKVSLTEDVNAKLKAWKVPENEWPRISERVPPLFSDGDSRSDPPVTVPGRSCVYCHATVPEP